MAVATLVAAATLVVAKEISDEIYSLAGSLLLSIPWIAAAQAPELFTSPDAAAEALIQAVQQNDTSQLTTIFGPAGQRILTSGDPAQDQAERRQFAQLAQSKYQLESDPNNPDRVILSIGNDDWPFPAPIVRVQGGSDLRSVPGCRGNAAQDRRQ